MIPHSLSRAGAQTLTIDAGNVQSTALWRRWNGALRELEDLPIDLAARDETSQALSFWLVNFRQSLDEGHRLSNHVSDEQAASFIQRTADQFMGALDHLLRDSLFQTPLTTEALLGSDGHTYLPETLRLFWADILTHATEEELKNLELDPALQRALRRAAQQVVAPQRSPMHLEDPSFFYTVSHPLAPDFVRWRDRMMPPVERKKDQSERVLNAFSDFMATADSLDRQLETSMRAFSEFSARESARIEDEFGSLRRENEQQAQEAYERIESIAREDRASLVQLQERLDRIAQTVSDYQQRVPRLQKEAEEEDARANLIEAANKRLEHSIARCEQIAAEQEKSGGDSILGAILGVAASLVATYFLRSAGIPIAITPTPGGGLGMTFIK